MPKKFFLSPAILFALAVLILAIIYFKDVAYFFAILFGGGANALRFIFSNPSGLTDLTLRISALIAYGIDIKKRHHAWGVVYDSATKEPLPYAHVTLMDVETNIVASCVTDMDGRYSFLVEHGFYHMVVFKKHYTFPSAKMHSRDSDEVYNDLYYGNYIEIRHYGDIINKNIPLDATDASWDEFSAGLPKFKFYHLGAKSLGQIINVFFIMGLLASVLSVFGGDLKAYNVVILALYVAMVLTNRAHWSRLARGSVFYKDTKLPLQYAVVRLKTLDDQKQVAHAVVDRLGNYYCLVPEGEYMVTVEKKNHDGSYTEILRESPVKVKKGYFNQDFKI